MKYLVYEISYLSLLLVIIYMTVINVSAIILLLIHPQIYSLSVVGSK